MINIKTFERFFSLGPKKKKLSMENIIEYVKKYFNSNEFDNDTVSTLKNNIKRIVPDDSLEVLLDNLLECSELKKSIDEYLDKYLQLYNQYLNDNDWFEEVQEYAVYDDEACWYYYKPLAKFIKNVC